MISIDIKIKNDDNGDHRITYYNEGPHTTAGVLLDFLTGSVDLHGEIESIVINPNDEMPEKI